MKKILSFLALALAFTACQNEPVESVSSNGLVDVVLTVDAPELGVTRADNDGQNGKNSAYGAIDFMNNDDWANYDLRYILEVYAADDNGTGEPIYRERLVNCLDKYAPTSFALRLVPNRNYKFVVFADFVAEGNAELTEPADKLAIADLYYNTADLRDIEAITTQPTWNAMNEVRDAYFVSENVPITTGGLNKTLTLTRPFAKLRVIATDLDYITGYAAPGYVEIEYKNEKIYKSFNAVNGQLNADEMTGAELEYAYDVSKTIPYSEGYDAYSTNQTLFTDYLLAVEGQQTTVNFDMYVYEDNTKAKLIHSQDFSTQIPIQRNHLTTIIGDLLTTQANITVEINDNFVDEFVKGWGDDNTTMIGTWGAGKLNANGDYEFDVTGENDFLVTINGAAVSNGKLAAGDYVLAEDAENGEELTFTVAHLQANATTRALTYVRVIGGDMNVALVGDEYAITLDLVLQFAENNDVRHAVYTYKGDVSCGEKPAIPTTYKLGLNNVDGWAKVYVYGWDGSVELFGEWPGIEMTEKEAIEGTDYFVYTLSAELTGKTINIVFNDGKDGGKQTADIEGVVVDRDNYFSNLVEQPAQPEEPEPSDTVLYLKPNAWTVDGARFAAYFFGAGEPTWFDMALVEGESDIIYAVTAPAGYPNVIFCRMNPNATANNWNNKWNQTVDLTIPTDGNNLYTIEDAWNDGGGRGTWSVYTK